MSKKCVALIILDGLGIGFERDSNPFYFARPKTFLELAQNYPFTSLSASGISVGLPWGEPGSCEAGHLTIGAGKIFYQNYPRITMAIRDGSFFENPVINQAFDFAKRNNSKVNLVGLLSSGISEASIEHIKALVSIAQNKNVNFAFHFFADGENSPPKSFLKLLNELPKDKLGSVVGRYYALDHKKNYNLLQRAYECLVGDIKENSNFEEIIQTSYKRGLNDNSIPPILVDKNKAISDGEAVIFFNFREDNIRPLVEAFINPNFDKFKIKKFNNLFAMSLVEYSKDFNIPVAFESQTITEPLSKVLADNNKTQFKISESIKYSLISFFFNGFKNEPYENEFRVSIPSDLEINIFDHPEMMALQITERVIEAMNNQGFDFILANYANLDFVGHRGDFDLAVKTIQFIDEEIKKIVDFALKNDIFLLITSDHGKIEQIINPQTGEPYLEHTTNPVPFYLIHKKFYGHKFPNWKNVKNEVLGLLSDIAPTILNLLDIEKPSTMTGQNLIENLF